MHPILFEIAGFQVHTYGALGATAFLAIAGISIVRGKRLGITAERMSDLIFWTSLTALFGSRVLFLVQNPDAWTGWTSLINIREGGLVFYGALVTGVIVGSALMFRSKMPFFATWDVFATAMPLGHGLTRLGCFAAGCCWGAPSEGGLAVVFTDPRSVAPLNRALHPVQLYEAAVLFAIAAVVNLVYAKRRWAGQAMCVYLVLYGIGRSVVEEFRGDASRGYFWSGLLGETLTYSQGVSALVIAVGIGVFGLAARRSAAKGSPPPR